MDVTITLVLLFNSYLLMLSSKQKLSKHADLRQFQMQETLPEAALEATLGLLLVTFPSDFIVLENFPIKPDYYSHENGKKQQILFYSRFH